MLGKVSVDETIPSAAMPPVEMLPDIAADSTWEFRTHQGRVYTFTGTRLAVADGQYTVVRVTNYVWNQITPRHDWYVQEIYEFIGGVAKGSVETWRKLDAVEQAPETV